MPGSLPPPPQPVIPVTVSELPPLERFIGELREIWDAHHLTNAGPKTAAFESLLKQRLGVSRLLSFCNGGSALIAGIRALDLSGTVVTTPFTFHATPHCLAWNGLEPIFADIDSDTLTLSPSSIEAALQEDTSAILGVHVYGIPCAVDNIDAIARLRGLRTIYDGAHAFGTAIGGRNIAAWGDLQMFSFNATKLTTTGEGGCVVFHDPALEEPILRLRRWGMLEEGDVTLAGINGMPTEIQSALGLCNLERFDLVWDARCLARDRYLERLTQVPGLRTLTGPREGVTLPPAYFPILIDPEEFGATRDDLSAKLKEAGILTRRYFYPLVSHLPCYRHCRGAEPGATPVAERAAARVLALPIFSGLGIDGADRVCDAIVAACPALL